MINNNKNKSVHLNRDEQALVNIYTYGPAVRVVGPQRGVTNGRHGRHKRANLDVRWLTQDCFHRLPFPFRRLLAKVLRFIFLVVLMVTVIINILFIIDVRNRLQQQQQNVYLQNDAEYQTNHPIDLHENERFSQRHSIRIEIVSSRHAVMAAIDGAIILDDAEEGKSRGIHVLVLNQMTGSIMALRHFDTYSPHEDEAMSLFLSMVSDERIIVFAIKDEGTFQLKKAARDLLTRMGSRRAQQLGWRDMWAMVVQKRLLAKSSESLTGGQSRGSLLGEAYSKSPDFNSWASPAVLQVEIELLPEVEDDCKWSSEVTPSGLFGHLFGSILPNDHEMESNTVSDFNTSSGSIFLPDDVITQVRRKHFCSRIEGYGSVCSCADPLPLRFSTNFDPNAKISQVPIVVIASNRPHYLYRMLRTLLTTPGCNPSMITVFIDGYYEEPLEVAKLFGLRGIQHTPIGKRNARISQHYKASLTATFNLYPHAQYAIVLEEDLDVSPDFFHFFAQTLHLLDEDKSLFCISAWNDQAYEHTASDSSLLYRVETMPGLGWMLTRTLYKEELEPRWPTPDKFWDWDMWMRIPEIRRGRECIVPDVPRTFHFGASGLNMNSYFQDIYFKRHAFNMDPSARLKNVNSMKRENYERLLSKLIRMAVLVDHSENPCDSNYLKATSRNLSESTLSSASKAMNNGGNNSYLVFIKMSHDRDFGTWLQMAKCLHTWDLDARGYHHGLWRLHYNGAHLLVIGTPFSPYSVFKPPHIVPITLNKSSAASVVAG